MASILDKFIKNSIGARGRVTDYTSKITPSGDFDRIYELNAILMSWNTILITPLRTYTYDPEFGSELYKYIFEPADDFTLDEIKNEIKTRLSINDDRASIESIDISYYPNKKGFVVNIIAVYQGVSNSLSTSIDESTYFNFLRSQ
jgi:phage baseplate assembly protein W